MIKAFPKIFAIGQDYIRDIFQDEVEITEKIDGSQFVFGKVGGQLFLRSKGANLYKENPDKMFKKACEYIQSIESILPDNMVFYCEYLSKPKHNTLAYERTPKNNLILFGVADTSEKFIAKYQDLEVWANRLQIEVVPIIFKGFVEKAEQLFEMINKVSILGGANMEGVVVKNYAKPFLLGGQPIPLMAGKYVSEKFKEVHQKEWSKEQTIKGKFDAFKDGFRTEARWEKAVQHLAEKGILDNSPKDIGLLIKEAQVDIEEEEKDNIKNFLYNEFAPEIYRYAVRGLPEWYKERLSKSSFN